MSLARETAVRQVDPFSFPHAATRRKLCAATPSGQPEHPLAFMRISLYLLRFCVCQVNTATALLSAIPGQTAGGSRPP